MLVPPTIGLFPIVKSEFNVRIKKSKCFSSAGFSVCETDRGRAQDRKERVLRMCVCFGVCVCVCMRSCCEYARATVFEKKRLHALVA